MLAEFDSISIINLAKRADEMIKAAGREITADIKKGRTNVLDHFLDIHKEFIASHIDANSTLVPMPRSAPLIKDGVWPSMSICLKLIQKGFGKDIVKMIDRISSVQTAHLQSGSDSRASIKQHFDSIQYNDSSGMLTPDKIVLVDDVITQGRNSVACYQKLRTQFPNVPIIVFTPVRTMSFDQINILSCPIQGKVKYFESGKSIVI